MVLSKHMLKEGKKSGEKEGGIERRRQGWEGE